METKTETAMLLSKAQAKYLRESGLLAEGIHTAFRKASSHRSAHEAWVAIRNLPDDEWDSVVKFVIDGLTARKK